MTTITIEEAAKFIGEEIILRGWVYNKRSSGKIIFLQIRDGTGVVQGVITISYRAQGAITGFSYGSPASMDKNRKTSSYPAYPRFCVSRYSRLLPRTRVHVKNT
jgi:hypothetical protein